MFNPISIGSIPNLDKTDAISCLIISFALTINFSFLITIFPPSTPVCNPTAPNSPIIGPGVKLVGPA